MLGVSPFASRARPGKRCGKATVEQWKCMARCVRSVLSRARGNWRAAASFLPRHRLQSCYFSSGRSMRDIGAHSHCGVVRRPIAPVPDSVTPPPPGEE